MTIESFRSHGYSKTSGVAYFKRLLERGLEIMVKTNTRGATCRSPPGGESEFIGVGDAAVASPGLWKAGAIAVRVRMRRKTGKLKDQPDHEFLLARSSWIF